MVHLGTLAWCFLIGPFENFWLDVLAPMLPTAPEMSVGLKIACILIGSIIIILTLAYYIPIGLGYQTSDIFAFMAADLVKKSYGIGLIISYAILFVIGVALGSSWGIGTLIAVVAYGPIIDRLMGIIEPFSFAVAGMKKKIRKASKMKRMSPARAIAYGLPGLATLFTFTMFTTYGLYFLQMLSDCQENSRV